MSLGYDKKSPTVGRDCRANGFCVFFFRREEHEEICSVVDILLIWSDMSIEKCPEKMTSFGAGVLSDCAIAILQ